jgi:protein-tyrosine-phosphatase
MFQGYILQNGIRHDGGPGSGPQGGSHIEHSATAFMHRAGKGEDIDKLMKEIAEKHGIRPENQHIIRRTLEHMQNMDKVMGLRKLGLAS